MTTPRAKHQVTGLTLLQAGVYIDSYQHRPHSGLRYRTPTEVRRTWEDSVSSKSVAELSTTTGSRPTTRPTGSRSGSGQIGAELKDGLRENPSWIAFARETRTVYHAYTLMAPDPFVPVTSPCSIGHQASTAEPRTWRRDEYPG